MLLDKQRRMKYGKRLEKLANGSKWYLNYKALKHLIRQLREEEAFHSSADDWDAAFKLFEKEFKNEAEKVFAYAVDKLRSIQEKTAALSQEVEKTTVDDGDSGMYPEDDEEASCSKPSGPSTMSIIISILEDVQTTMTFMQDNVEGMRKISKKFDKKLGMQKQRSIMLPVLSAARKILYELGNVKAMLESIAVAKRVAAIDSVLMARQVVEDRDFASSQQPASCLDFQSLQKQDNREKGLALLNEFPLFHQYLTPFEFEQKTEAAASTTEARSTSSSSSSSSSSNCRHAKRNKALSEQLRPDDETVSKRNHLSPRQVCPCVHCFMDKSELKLNQEADTPVKTKEKNTGERVKRLSASLPLFENHAGDLLPEPKAKLIDSAYLRQTSEAVTPLRCSPSTLSSLPSGRRKLVEDVYREITRLVSGNVFQELITPVLYSLVHNNVQIATKNVPSSPDGFISNVD
eukprot:g472.t1